MKEKLGPFFGRCFLPSLKPFFRYNAFLQEYRGVLALFFIFMMASQDNHDFFVLF